MIFGKGANAKSCQDEIEFDIFNFDISKCPNHNKILHPTSLHEVTSISASKPYIFGQLLKNTLIIWYTKKQ